MFWACSRAARIDRAGGARKPWKAAHLGEGKLLFQTRAGGARKPWKAARLGEGNSD